MSRVLITIIIILGNINLSSSQEIREPFIDLTESDSTFFKINFERCDPILKVLKLKFWKEGWEKPKNNLEDDDIVIISEPESRYLILDSFNSPHLIKLESIDKIIHLKDLANENSEIWKKIPYPFYFYVITEKYPTGQGKFYKMKIRPSE